MPRFRAVLFDLGGVVFDSPFETLAAYEVERGLDPGALNRVIVGTGHDGAWGRNERGELTPTEFLAVFQGELEAAGIDADASEIMRRIRTGLRIRPAMIRAVDRIREEGLLTAAVTNNWREGDGSTSGDRLVDHFDAFIESTVVGINKPDPRIYEMALAALGVGAREAVFLDDIGRNLKSALALGITTIKVTSPVVALAKLEGLLGFDLG